MNSQQEFSREEQEATVKGMLLSNMLEHLEISLDRYFRKTSYPDRECHIQRCRQCACVRECVHMLLGEAIEPETFCPNFVDFEPLAYN
jgi:hypothetical protein